jgi:hypothetical protein
VPAAWAPELPLSHAKRERAGDRCCRVYGRKSPAGLVSIYGLRYEGTQSVPRVHPVAEETEQWGDLGGPRLELAGRRAALGDSVGSPRVVDHEAPATVCLTTQDVRVPCRQPHRFTVWSCAVE